MLDGAFNEGVRELIEAADAVAEDDASTGVFWSEAQGCEITHDLRVVPRADAAQEDRRSPSATRTLLASRRCE